MRCAVCKKEEGEVMLFEGVLDSEMIMCCEPCSEVENIPLIRRPTLDKIERSKESYSVRERMEKLSGFRRATPISDEQVIVQENLARLKTPPRKEVHPDVVDDYYWKVNMGRRRKKITISQMANQTNIDAKIIEEIEKGKIPKDYEEIFMKLESFLGVKLLKVRPKIVTMTRTIDEEKEILERVRKKMNHEVLEEVEDKDEKLDRIIDDKFDFSKKENIQNLTLNDLVELKRKRDKEKRKIEEKSRKDSIMGEEIELDLDEL